MKLRIIHELEISPSPDGYHATKAALLESVFCALHFDGMAFRLAGAEVLQHAIKIDDIDEVTIPEDFVISMFAEKGLAVEEAEGKK